MMLRRSDIHVRPAPQRPCPNHGDACEQGTEATHIVEIDLRNAGLGVGVFEGCESCCNVLADRIRVSLPDKSARAAATPIQRR
jgi:hypothetical protein